MGAAGKEEAIVGMSDTPERKDKRGKAAKKNREGRDETLWGEETTL